MQDRKSASNEDATGPPGNIVDKQAIIEKIVTALGTELERYERSARSAHAEATDEQSKAENKYDTRGLEASYLARGQSLQAADVMHAMDQYAALSPRQFAVDEPIDIGAIVALERQGERTVYFVGPRGGGITIEHEGESVLVITPQSPLGQQLVGQKQGARLHIKIAGSSDNYRLVAVA